MRTVALSLLPWILACTALCPPRIARADDQPVVDTPVGHAVHDDLRAWYRRKAAGEHAAYPYREALAGLRAPDPEQRQQSGKYLHAFFLQTLYDEEHGLAPDPGGMKLGGGPQDEAAELRWLAAREFAQVTVPGDGTEALLPALWLLREDPRNANYGAEALARIKGQDADQALREIVASCHPRSAILVVGLDAVASRCLTDAEMAVRKLCTHYDDEVHAAARRCLEAWMITDAPAYDELAGLRWLEEDLSRLASALLDRPDPDAAWCRLKETVPPWNEGDEPYVYEHYGWLKGRTEREVELLDWFGLPRTFEAKQAAVFDEKLAARAADVMAERKAWCEATAEDGYFNEHYEFPAKMGALRFSRSGSEWEGSLPEALMAAWSLAAGDRKTAAGLLLPLLKAWGDHEAFFAYMRDQLARRLDHLMLEQFVAGRYAEALPIAQHLAGEAFHGFVHHDRADGLAAQLQGRLKEDFVSLDLPTPETWEALRATLSREDQVRYLARRIRLIRAEQVDIPGSVSYGREQWRNQDPEDKSWSANRVVLLNPYSELWQMNLAAEELPLLFEVVRGDDYIRAYSLQRFLPQWPINLHRARWVAGTLVNSAAQRDLLDPEILRSRDDEAINAHLEAAKAWCEAEGGVTLGDRLERIVATDADWDRVKGAAYRLNHLDREALGRAAVLRLETDEEHRGALLMVAAHAGAAGAVTYARASLVNADPVVRGWAALVLVKSGKQDAREGIDALLEVLAASDEPALQNGAVEALLATKDPAATRGLLALLRPDAPHPTTMLVVQRLFLAGHTEARDLLLRLLDEHGPRVYEALPWMSGQFEKVTRPRNAAWELSKWSADVPRNPHQKPTKEQREAWLADVRVWVRKAFDEVKAGEDGGLKPIVVAEPFVKWSGHGRWIRRL